MTNCCTSIENKPPNHLILKGLVFYIQASHRKEQQVCVKIFIINCVWGNVNQNHNKIHPHTSQDGYYQRKIDDKKC